MAIVKGQKLCASPLKAMDLRGGAALTVAALGADGVSELSGIHYIERGYVDLDKMLTQLGADIKKTN